MECGELWPCASAGKIVRAPSTEWHSNAGDFSDHLVLRFKDEPCLANLDRLARLLGQRPLETYSTEAILAMSRMAEQNNYGVLVRGTHLEPLFQTRVGAPQGNCTEASVASLLGVPLDAVPDLYDHALAPADWGPWREQRFLEMHHWLLDEFGLKWCQIRGGWDVAQEVFARTGLYDRHEIRSTYYLMMGKNPDGVGHCTVGQNGVVAWDPNPAQRGLVDNDENVFLLPAAYFPSDRREWPGFDLTPSAETP